jgi:site-specific DNA recombinase
MNGSSGSSAVSEAQERPGGVAAIYARVSSERQRRDETIRSQTAALRELADARGLLVPQDLVFEDDGFSGASLRRPALERLRDRAAEGCFELLLCHAPDRLARRYAYQVLLLEELQRAGVEVVFAKEPERAGTPEDELLRQFQGMIAEYERAQIAERCRRGKLHRARAGAVAVLANAPYGYRYVKRTEHVDAFYEIDEVEARIVREVFRRYTEDGESIGRIARALGEQGVPTRTGKTGWNPATIWGMLRNPAYAGQAAFGKTHVTGAPTRMTRAARQRGERSGRAARERVASEQWKRIPVPALVTDEQFALVQDLLQRNKRFSPRNTRRPSLLQGILVCRECGYAYYRSSTRSPNGILREYYRCSGSDSSRRPQGRVCHNRPVRMADVDELVWSQVLRLLDDPTLIQAEIERRLATLRAAHPASQRREGLQRDLARAESAMRRLIDGYQEQLITLEELRARTPELRAREATLRAQLDALDAELHDAATYLKLTETLEGFRARLTAGAENLTVEQRQNIVRLVIREVLIGEDDVTIRHSIPTPTGDQPPGSLLRWDSREGPDPGARSFGADPARAAGHAGADEPRLQAQRHQQPVRRAGRRDRQGHPPAARPPPRDRVQKVPAKDRQASPSRARRPPDPRQLLDPQDSGDQQVAGRPSALSPALHPDQRQLAEPRRALVRRADRPQAQARRAPQRQRAQRRHRGLDRQLERKPQALRVGQEHRRDPRQPRRILQHN